MRPKARSDLTRPEKGLSGGETRVGRLPAVHGGCQTRKLHFTFLVAACDVLPLLRRDLTLTLLRAVHAVHVESRTHLCAALPAAHF